MTPSEYIDYKATRIHEIMAVAAGRLIIAIVRRRVGPRMLAEIADDMKIVVKEAQDLSKFLSAIKEQEDGAPQKTSPRSVPK